MALDRIETCFSDCKAEQRAALGIFVSAGDPDLSLSTELLLGLPDAGADFVELGMPFSDPMADGPGDSGSIIACHQRPELLWIKCWKWHASFAQNIQMCR